MVRRSSFVLALLAVAAFAGCQQKPMAPFKAPDGHFEVKLPGEPKAKATAAAGAALKMYSVEAWNKAYMVGWADLPIPKWEREEKTKSRLFDARDGALAAVSAKSHGTTKVIKLDNRFPGIEFGGSAEDKHLRAQIFLVGHRLYQVLLVCGNMEELTSPEAEEYFSSFKVFDVEGLLPPGSSAALPPPPPMHAIESTAGRFTASYPEKPKKFARKIGEHEFTGYESETKDGTCAVAYVDLPIPGGESDEKIRERIDAARTDVLASVQGNLTNEKDATVGSGRPGRDFTATANDKHLRGRVFLVGARLYRITVLGTEGFLNSEEATAFLDSFKLK